MKANHLQLTKKHTSVVSCIVHPCKETTERMDTNTLHLCRGFFFSAPFAYNVQEVFCNKGLKGHK